ncbi:MAG: SMI1/KNR4 family protein [Herpetosiphonaceae bacterium]|nr:SMI1/KNR4 family protein [Herpetosiphonaceae bacterium]
MCLNVNGLTLPTEFTAAVERRIFPYRIGLLEQRGGVDAYGHTVYLDLGDVWQNQDNLDAAVQDLPIGFEPNVGYGHRLATNDIPGSIPDITDFSRVVCFATSSSGAPYCFDFRDNVDHPSIIHWDDGTVYWRRIAPDFDSFLAIFGLAV